MELTEMQRLIVNSVIPVSVLIIMFSMGLSLRGADFVRVLRAPRSVAVAMIGQYVFVPLVAVVAIWAMAVPPAIAVGAIIVAAIPGGALSNGFVYVGRGNAALSVSLTAVSQLVGMITIPLYISWALARYYADVPDVEFDVLRSIIVVLALNIVPMGIGMLVLKVFEGFATKVERTLRKISLVLLFAVIIVVIWPNFAVAARAWASAGVLAMIVCLGGVLFGNIVSRLVGLDRRDGFTNGVEIGIQNLSTALLIAVTLMNRPELSLYVVVYSVVSPLVMAASVVIFNLSGRGASSVRP